MTLEKQELPPLDFDRKSIFDEADANGFSHDWAIDTANEKTLICRERQLLASMSREAAALADYAELKTGYDQMVENLEHEMDLKVAALALVEELRGDRTHLLNVVAELRAEVVNLKQQIAANSLIKELSK